MIILILFNNVSCSHHAVLTNIHARFTSVLIIMIRCPHAMNFHCLLMNCHCFATVSYLWNNVALIYILQQCPIIMVNNTKNIINCSVGLIVFVNCIPLLVVAWFARRNISVCVSALKIRTLNKIILFIFHVSVFVYDSCDRSHTICCVYII